MNNKQLKYYLDRKCSEDGCIYLCAPGYTICEGHLHGFPRKLPDEVIEYLSRKKEMKNVTSVNINNDKYNVRMQEDQRKKLSSVIPILKEVLETEEGRFKCASGKMISGNYNRMEYEVKHFKEAFELLESMLDYKILTDTGRTINDNYRHEIVRKEIIESMEEALEKDQRDEVGIIFLDNIKKQNGIYTVEGHKQYMSHNVFTFNVYKNKGKKGQKVWRVHRYKNNWYIEKRE